MRYVYIFKFFIAVDDLLIFNVLKLILFNVLPKSIQNGYSCSLLHSNNPLQRRINLKFWRVANQTKLDRNQGLSALFR